MHIPAVDRLTPSEIDAIRADFPILGREVNGHPLAYLDSGATSQKPASVIAAERDYYELANSAVHRGAHTLAAEATELFENARETVAAFVGATANNIVWTSNATEGINLVAYGFSNASLGRGGAEAEQFVLIPGDEIVVTEMEHHSNLVPWQELAFRTGATLRVIGVNDDGSLSMDDAAAIIGEHTRILAFTHISNVLGTINPVRELVALAREAGAFVVLDACQSVPHLPVNFPELDVDFAVFSGHKMLAPTGIGVLYGKEELLNALPPFLTGGSMITTVGATESGYLPSPQRFEAGTQRVSQVIALASAIDYLTAVGMDKIADWEHHLGARAFDGLARIPGIQILGPGAGQERVGLVSFDVPGIHSHDMGQFLDDQGIAVRVGHHCAQPLHRRFGVTSTTRISTYLYTTEAEVDAAVAAVAEAREFFGVTA